MRLDHVALAAHDALPVLDTLVADLGGTVLQGAEQAGFRPVQVRVGTATEGMIIELLEPHRVDELDFLDRFLRARGEGPHHLTFKVSDLPTELVRLRDAGITPTGVFLDSPRWKEAFITPAEAHGTVVQLAQGGLDFPTFADQFASARTDGPYGEPRWWPDPPRRAEQPSILEAIVISTPRLDAAATFYTEVLRGTAAARDAGAVVLRWPGGGCIRFEADADRPPGITRLEVKGPGPARVLTLAGTTVVVSPGCGP